MANEKVFGARWRVIDQLGRGGQGVVYKVADQKGLPTETDIALQLKEGLKVTNNEIFRAQPEIGNFRPLIDSIRSIAIALDPPLAAVKELLPFEDGVAGDEQTAIARMKNELNVLASVKHPALIRVLDSHLEQRWFAMEFFEHGPLSRQLDRFRGNVAKALQAIRPVIDAVQQLHANGIVHRDVKPDNVFVGSNGDLVLGDCGLALKLENQDRLTLSFENVGTRDYQPPWTYGLRVDEVKPNFDVFGLAKLLWAMISGRPRFPLEDFDQHPHDLRTMFPDNSDVLFAHRIFKKCIVRREAQCALKDAAELLQEVDAAIDALHSGATVPTMSRKMRCRFCGIGEYEKLTNFQATGNSMHGQNNSFFACSNCGHLVEFYGTENRKLPGWEE